MQNRIDQLFEKKKTEVLSIFFTAGFPELNDTLTILEGLHRSDADMIEIGIPFSDPLADGPTIQHSSTTSLANGMCLELLFRQLKGLRSITQKPVLLMGYLNSVLQYGIERFYRECSEAGVDGVILPDLPVEEFLKDHKNFSIHFNIKVVFLVSPETDEERIKLLDELSGGFLYVLSSNSTTGGPKNISDKLKNKLKLVKNPALIGFGIRGNKEFSEACEIASGAVIGSSFVNLLANSKNFQKDILEFTNSVKQKLVRS